MSNKLIDILYKRVLCFDGAMGTMLQAWGLEGGEIPEIYNFTNPLIVSSIHKQYVNAGADIITANTFGANRLKLKNTGYTVSEVITKAVEIAKGVSNDRFVALDIGPVGQLMEPFGTLDFNSAYDIYKEQVTAGYNAGADLILIETMTDIYEAKAAVLAAKENSPLPVFCTMTFDESGRTLMGTDPRTMTFILQGLGVDALGINCSLGPKEILDMADEILKYSNVPVMVQPNAGLPCCREGHTYYDMKPEEFAFYINLLIKKGVSIVGGCCGSTPDFIKAIQPYVKGSHAPQINTRRYTAACSSSKSVILDEGIKIIGERINPTGKKKLKEAIRNNDMGYILGEALSQRDAGADILDVNVGLPEIDEKEFMVKTIREIQGTVNVPLQIDSSSFDVLEAGVRIYNGKPIINSVNGKEEVMKQVFPIVKKYGALVIGLTLDENGIPKTCEERVSIAEKIIKTAEEYGISRENLLIDCLVLTASAQQEEVMETIKAVKAVKERFGVKTCLGVSNVSHGLPDREVLNRTYLTMALAAGLDAPIINPLSKDMMDTIYSFRVLSNQDKEAEEYIARYEKLHAEDSIKKSEKSPWSGETGSDMINIIVNGTKEQAVNKTNELLIIEKPLDIINKYIIPGLNIVGQKYETGEIFLPQLMRSAETAKKSFETIKYKMVEAGEKKASNNKILLATVKGDVHDIGKNIVKILLDNFGFNVIDMGKDVAAEDIVSKVKEENIKLVGLSALMTTTVRSMEDTIKALKDSNLPCKVMVGGAVLTEEYAHKIGADFYAKDAMEGVRIAQKVFETIKI